MDELGALVGEWRMEALVGGKAVAAGRTVFGWLYEGSFLAQHADAEPSEDTPREWAESSPFPVDAIIGLDDTHEHCSMLYADGRGVRRVYQLTVEDGVWRIWRDAPGFHQRFTGTFGDGGATITGAWESSRDGAEWAHDFEVRYTRG